MEVLKTKCSIEPSLEEEWSDDSSSFKFKLQLMQNFVNLNLEQIPRQVDRY